MGASYCSSLFCDQQVRQRRADPLHRFLQRKTELNVAIVSTDADTASIVNRSLSVKWYFIDKRFNMKLTRPKCCSGFTIALLAQDRSEQFCEGNGIRFTSAVFGIPPGKMATCVAIAPRIRRHFVTFSDKEPGRNHLTGNLLPCHNY